MQKTPPFNQRKQTNLETANAMFKEAFLVKKTRFAKEYPHLTEEKIHKMTVDYFRNLQDEDENLKGRTI